MAKEVVRVEITSKGIEEAMKKVEKFNQLLKEARKLQKELSMMHIQLLVDEGDTDES